MSFPKKLMIGKQCYLCVLAQWPPKTNNQYRKYEKAVSIRLSLGSPLTVSQGLHLVNITGLNHQDLLQELMEGKIVNHKPAATFYHRSTVYLEAVNHGISR
jgi:hypothetical protein